MTGAFGTIEGEVPFKGSLWEGFDFRDDKGEIGQCSKLLLVDFTG